MKIYKNVTPRSSTTSLWDSYLNQLSKWPLNLKFFIITASHNPKEDNGYKVFWSNGPQIKPPHDKLILKSINEHLKPMDDQAFSDDLYGFKDLIIGKYDENDFEMDRVVSCI